MIERILEDKRSVLDLDCSCPQNFRTRANQKRFRSMAEMNCRQWERPELKMNLRRPEFRFNGM